ncbi:hypothetical protein FEM48_Zijuj08G0008700 [Ziziphus jujuba var. spinosa]|uniref:Uncharacterized protein n=1 Tax=Ziziphus jujuba var. spinosa TaxID=714518 RepID=A0A978UW18_ZIZJJ|nr:hypothetical protein FEM48_Zijuj08G0008700 [Ziziphus jujuba var. spinosa]
MESNVSSEGYRFQFFLVLGPDPWPPLQFMTTANAIRIGNLFHEVLQCEQSSRTNMVGMKYMRIRVELDVRKPIVTGFIQKAGCTLPSTQNHTTNGDLYGPWLRAEADSHTAIYGGSVLRRIELPQGDFSDTFLGDTNIDPKNAEAMDDEMAKGVTHTNAPQGDDEEPT